MFGWLATALFALTLVALVRVLARRRADARAARELESQLTDQLAEREQRIEALEQRVVELEASDRERQQLVRQLDEAQKLEAVGQLAGGIAHDFNNSLTVIRGNVQLLIEEPSVNAELAEQLREVAGAADRAASLTQQLLVFSRRQPSNMRPPISTRSWPTPAGSSRASSPRA